MKRETTNAIRTVLEDWLPPVVRDSSPMRWLFRRHCRSGVRASDSAEWKESVAKRPSMRDAIGRPACARGLGIHFRDPIVQ
jgi:hypothetical protein